MIVNNLYSNDDKMIDKSMADLAYGIVFQLLLSSIENIKTFESPGVGDWCIELTTISQKTPNLLGIVREISNDGYIIQTVLGQTVTWTNCKMVKIPDMLLDKQSHHSLLQLLKLNEKEIDYI